MGCCLDRKSDQVLNDNKKPSDQKTSPKLDQNIEIINPQVISKGDRDDSTLIITENPNHQEDEENSKLHLKEIKDLKAVILYQKEQIMELQAELEKKTREVSLDDEDILASQTVYIGYLEKAKEDLELQLQNSGNYSQEDIARLILERDQMINNYNSMQNDYKNLLEHYATLYNQYLIMTGQSQEKLD